MPPAAESQVVRGSGVAGRSPRRSRFGLRRLVAAFRKRTCPRFAGERSEAARSKGARAPRGGTPTPGDKSPHAKAGTSSSTRAPSSSTTLLGGRPSASKTMNTDDNSSVTALPRGRVGSNVKRTQSTVTKVNTIRRRTWASLRLKGEAWPEDTPRAEDSRIFLSPGHSGHRGAFCVVGDSRLGKGCACDDGRPARADHWKQCRAGVRAAIVAWKPGNAGGAKGGRKWKMGTEREPSEKCYRLPTGLETTRPERLGTRLQPPFASESMQSRRCVNIALEPPHAEVRR